MTPTADITVYHAGSIGRQALRLLTIPKRWLVLEVYQSCFYCIDDFNNIICIGAETIGRGPFVINGIEIAELLRVGLVPGDSLSAKSCNLYHSNTRSRIVLSKAETWDTCFSNMTHDYLALDRDLLFLAEQALSCAPVSGLGPTIPAIVSGQGHCHTQTPPDWLSGLLQQQVLTAVTMASSSNWKKDDTTGAEHLAEILSPLIGCGPGLTPSGDDFCSGVVLGLARTNNTRVAEELASSLYERAREKTTRISLAFYRALAESYVSEHQARLLDSFGNNDRTDQGQVLAAFCSQGATSGWDMLAGFSLGLRLGKEPSLVPEAGTVSEMIC